MFLFHRWSSIYLGRGQNIEMNVFAGKAQQQKSDILQYTLVCWDKWLVDQASEVPSIIFFIISHRLRALKTLCFYFCKFVKNTKKYFEFIFARKSWKRKIILGTSDTWSESHLSQQPSKPANQQTSEPVHSNGFATYNPVLPANLQWQEFSNFVPIECLQRI